MISKISVASLVADGTLKHFHCYQIYYLWYLASTVVFESRKYKMGKLGKD